MNPHAAASRLAVFAVQHADTLLPLARAQLLSDAAAFLPEPEADLCRATASFIRHAEDHQLKLKDLFATR